MLRDQAFDLRPPHRDSFAHNVTALTGWRSYRAYRADMEALLLPARRRMRAP